MLSSKSRSSPTPTMRDVAKMADVSQSTVSRVLSAKANSAVPISEETIQRVQAAVRQLKYHPNLAARALRGQKTHMIAMMIADISNPFYHFMVRRVQDVAQQHGYDVLIANTDHDVQREQHFLEGIVRRPVDGVILTPYHLAHQDIQRLIDRTGVKVVTLGDHVFHPQVDRVYANDEQAAYDAVMWLIRERQHKRIAYVGAAGTHPSQRRQRAFLRAMTQSKLAVPKTHMRYGDFGLDSGAQAMTELLKLKQPPTAVFACNDLMALGCLTAIQKAGLRVPHDVAVLGFDDIPEAQRTAPKLTTIAQYPSEMGEQLAKAMFERIAMGDQNLVEPARSFEVPCKLIVRESA